MLIPSNIYTISNLPSVPFHFFHFPALDEFFRVDGHSESDWGTGRRTSLFNQLINKSLPDLLALLVVKIRKIQCHMNSGDEGVVESPDSISCEE